jgi:hypothetical protein
MFGMDTGHAKDACADHAQEHATAVQQWELYRITLDRIQALA